MAHIDIEDASVSYFLHKSRAWKKGLKRGVVGAEIKVGRRYLEITALRNITLSLKSGDRVGLIGINGSGKSTLLKLCAGALAAQSGQITVEGQVSPQFALGSGMRPTLSGRQNIELKCLYMGVPQRSIGDLVAEIKDLSGLGDYLELPLQSYSAGMRSRLVMSLLRLVRGEILIMDEWISVADPLLNSSLSSIQTSLIERAQILLLASHSLRVLEEWVDKVVWLDDGKVAAFGRTDEVFPQYEAWMRKQRASRSQNQGKGGNARSTAPEKRA